MNEPEDDANPNDVYRRHTPGTWLTQHIADEAAHATLDDHYRHAALQDAHKELETITALAEPSTLTPSDSGHKSPWETARRMWGSP